MVMFSGLVSVGMLTACGSSSLIVLVITGTVIRKMMRSTSITSTSGVVLISAIIAPSSVPPIAHRHGDFLRCLRGRAYERAAAGGRRPAARPA